MASMSSGKVNGTKKPGYISSYMSFLEGKDVDDPDDPSILPDKTSGEEMEGVTIKEEIKKESPDSFELPDLIDGVDKEIKVEEGEEIVSKDYIPSDFPITDGESTNSSEATSLSEGGNASRAGRRNVARRGKQKKGTALADVRPQRESLRRTSRVIKRYSNTEAAESDGLADSDDPDFHLSDSDDDPDFNPVDKKTGASEDEEELPRRGRAGRGRGGTVYRGVFSPQGRNRGLKRPLDKGNSTSTNKSSTTTTTATTTTTTTTTTTPTIVSPAKRRGRPPSYQPIVTRDSIEGKSGTDGTAQGGAGILLKGPTQLSSAYNYAGGQAQRQNQNIRLPEGPELTPEQLEMSGDFVMAKTDQEAMKNPPIWRIDGKSLLQKFQAFEKDGKTLYRNISTYSGWTSQAKSLYLGVKVTFVFQSRYDTVVQMMGFKPEGDDDDSDDSDDDDDDEDEDEDEEVKQKKKEKKEKKKKEKEEKEKEKKSVAEASKDDADMQAWLANKTPQQDIEISEELRCHMPSFEIYLQTLISQALDNNFLFEIYEENDEYFVERVRVIDDLAEDRKKKILEIVKWNDRFKKSLDTWPCVNVMVRTTKTGEVPKTDDLCESCSDSQAMKLFQLYGQPYSKQTLRYSEPVPSETDEKNYNVCEICANISQLYNKVAHQKYDYYSQCKSTVTNMRVVDTKKGTTAILQDLLANDHWITQLFRSMCTTWIKVDRLHEVELERLKKVKTATAKTDEQTTTTTAT